MPDVTGPDATTTDDAVHDVAIVGAGPVGVFLAAALAQSGLDVIVLERRTRLHRHSRAIGIHPPALAALERLGVGDEIVAVGVRIDRGVLRIRGQERARLDFVAAGGPYPFVVALPQLETERILRERLAELAPDALRTGVEVTSIERHASSVSLLVSAVSGSGSAEHDPDPPAARGAGRAAAAGENPPASEGRAAHEVSRVRARIVVGADGTGGIIGAAIGDAAAPRVQRYPYDFLMGDFADTGDDGPVAVLHLHPAGIVESFPLPGGLRRWVTHLPGGAVDRAPGAARGSVTDAHLLSGLIAERIAPAVGPDPSTATMTSAFEVRRRILTRMTTDDGRLIVIGDAAHEVSPIGGQGMNLGWLDADALAGLIPPLLAEFAARTDRADFEDAGPGPAGVTTATRALRDFERTRLRSARAAARISEFNMTVGRPSSATGFALRQAVVSAARVPPLAATLARAFTMHGR